MVVAPPESDEGIHGNTTYMQTYRDYYQSAETLEYVPYDPKVDLVGGTTVAVCSFEVVYKLQGTKHHDRVKTFSFSPSVMACGKSCGERCNLRL